ncbi:AAA ATPase, partial [Fragilariopsis cylindrus CCMP1102]
SFSDVAGLDNILPEVREIVSYLQNPSGYHSLGAMPPRGILLHGEPGTGKTLLAKAVAGEAECDAFCVCSGSDFCEMYVGRGAARVRKLFKEARKVALKNYDRKQRLKQGRWLPSWGLTAKHVDTGKKEEKKDNSCLRPATAIIFIDELDALAKSRSYDGITSSNDERDQTLNQLLTEMDGFHTNKNDVPVTVIVIAATNIPNVLDPAILRRFDRQIHVPFPDNRGRMEILKVHAAKTRCRFSTICWDYLAEQTPNFSGSDLKQVVNDAALLAVRGGSKHIEQGHLLQAIQR